MAAPTERTGPSVNSLTPPVTEAIQPDHDASLSGAPAGGRATDRGLRETRPPDKDAYSLAGTSKTIASPRRENGSPGPTPRRRESGVTRALLRGAPAMSRASATWPRGVIKVQAEERVGSGQVPPPDRRNRHPTALEAALIVAHQDLLPVVQRHLAVRTRPGIDHESSNPRHGLGLRQRRRPPRFRRTGCLWNHPRCGRGPRDQRRGRGQSSSTEGTPDGGAAGRRAVAQTTQRSRDPRGRNSEDRAGGATSSRRHTGRGASTTGAVGGLLRPASTTWTAPAAKLTAPGTSGFAKSNPR